MCFWGHTDIEDTEKNKSSLHFLLYNTDKLINRPFCSPIASLRSFRLLLWAQTPYASVPTLVKVAIILQLMDRDVITIACAAFIFSSPLRTADTEFQTNNKEKTFISTYTNILNLIYFCGFSVRTLHFELQILVELFCKKIQLCYGYDKCTYNAEEKTKPKIQISYDQLDSNETECEARYY